MKVTCLGVNSAFAVGDLYNFEEGYKLYKPKFQSNFLLEFDSPGKVSDDKFRLVIDFGSDIRHSLAYQGLKMGDIDAWYCSHPHADHVGGIEGIALSTFFNPFWNKAKVDFLNGDTDVVAHLENMKNQTLPAECKPTLYAHCSPRFEKKDNGELVLSSVMYDIWETSRAGLSTLQGSCGMNVELDTYFDLKPMFDNKPIFIKDGDSEWKIYTVISTHVVQGTKLMPSYGLMFENEIRDKTVYMPTDTQLMSPPQIKSFYNRADVIFQDCETGPRSNVHPHIDDLRKLDPELKSKLLLYHYTEEPQVDEGEFGDVLQLGQVLEY